MTPTPPTPSTSTPSTSTPLAYELTGPVDGVPLVLLHAFPLDRELWRPVVERLEGARCALVDLPGLGASPLPDGEPDLGVSVAGVLGVLDDVGWERAVVAGVSMGGYVTLGLLRDHPERVAGAGLIDTKVEADAPEARANRLRMADAVLGEAGRRALAPLAESLIGPTSRQRRPEVVDSLVRRLQGVPLTGVAWSQRAMAARPDTSQALAAATVPVRIVVGAEDALTPPEAARAMAALAGDAEVTVVPESGHLTPLEAPQAVAAALADLIGQVRSVS